jgi:hypothetical protein
MAWVSYNVLRQEVVKGRSDYPHDILLVLLQFAGSGRSRLGNAAATAFDNSAVSLLSWQ